ncbi:MAG: aromatic amino acid DMT transporter YddG [Candidatus Caldatribacteriota bacterium]
MFSKKISGGNNNTLLGILAIIFWGSTVAFSRSLTEQLGTVTAGGMVFILSAAFAWLYLLIISPHSFKKMFHLSPNYLWGCGILFVIYMTTLYLAIGLSNSRLQVIEISIINYLWPGLTLLFSVPILKKRAKLFIIPGIILGFIGVYIAMNPYHNFSFVPFIQNIQNNILPYIFAFIAAISWALYSTFARKWAAKDEEGAVPIFLLFTGILLLLLRTFFQEEAAWNIRTCIELFYMAVFPTFLAYTFWDKAMRHGNIVLVASISYFTPILSVFISSMYLNISIDIRLWIASLLVVAGALISKYSISE